MEKIPEIWRRGVTKKLGRYSVFVVEPEDVQHIPNDKTITYVGLVVDY